MDLQVKLNNMVGKSFMYNTKNYKVLAFYDLVDETITIATDKELISIKSDVIEEELLNFLPVSEEMTTAVSLIGNNRRKMDSLVDLVKANIKSVQDNTDNIPKANSINSSIKLILDVAKLEIEAVKLGLKN